VSHKFYIVGQNGKLRTFDGSSFSDPAVPFPYAWFHIGAISGAEEGAGLVCIEANGFNIAWFVSGAWSIANVGVYLQDCCMATATEFYFVANGGGAVHGYTLKWSLGAGFTWVYNPASVGDNQSACGAIWAVGSDNVYFAGGWRRSTSNERIARWNGITFQWDPTSAGLGVGDEFMGITGIDADNIWFCDLNGAVYKGKWGGPWSLEFNGAAFTKSYLRVNNLSANATTGEVFMAGVVTGTQEGVLYRRDPSTGVWSLYHVEPNNSIRYSDVWSAGIGYIFATQGANTFGSENKHAYYNGLSWAYAQDFPAVPAQEWYGVWGHAPHITAPYLLESPTSPNGDVTSRPMVWSVGADAVQADIVELILGGKSVVLNNIVQSEFTGTVTLNAQNGYDVSVVSNEDFWKSEYSIAWSIKFSNGIEITETGTIVKYVTLPYPDDIKVHDYTKDYNVAIDFPLRFLEDGDVALVNNEDAIKQNLVNSVMLRRKGVLLSTMLGSMVPLSVFDDDDPAMMAFISHEVVRASSIGEPRAAVDASARILRSDDGNFTLAFPFAVKSQRKWDSVKIPIDKVIDKKRG